MPFSGLQEAASLSEAEPSAEATEAAVNALRAHMQRATDYLDACIQPHLPQNHVFHRVLCRLLLRVLPILRRHCHRSPFALQ